MTHPPLRPRLRDLILAEDWLTLAAEVRERFSCEVPAADLAGACRKKLLPPKELRHGCLDQHGQDSTWELWLRNRLDDLRIDLAKRLGSPDADATSCLMHVFFIWLDETDEMLERLRRPERTLAAAPARSRITKTVQKLTPINRVAERVAPPPDEEAAHA